MTARQYTSIDPDGRTVLHYDELREAAVEVYNFFIDTTQTPEKVEMINAIEAIIEWVEGEISG